MWKRGRLLIRRVIRSTQVRPTPDNMSLKTCDCSKALEKKSEHFHDQFSEILRGDTVLADRAILSKIDNFLLFR